MPWIVNWICWCWIERQITDHITQVVDCWRAGWCGILKQRSWIYGFSSGYERVIQLERFSQRVGYSKEKIKPFIIYCDEQTLNHNFKSWTKYVNFKYLFIRDVHKRGKIELLNLPTSEKIITDSSTKVLNWPKHRKCLKKLVVKNIYKRCWHVQYLVLQEQRKCTPWFLSY